MYWKVLKYERTVTLASWGMNDVFSCFEKLAEFPLKVRIISAFAEKFSYTLNTRLDQRLGKNLQTSLKA